MSLNTINVGFENTTAIDLHYEDTGEGKPVILIHGWPIDSVLWANQRRALNSAGLRVITYDRRGFGKSSRPLGEYDYDTLADDLHHIVSFLDLNEVTLVGFTTGCGEIFRYLGTYGSERILKSVFLTTLPPTPQCSATKPRVKFEKFKQARITEGLEFILDFTQNFFSTLQSQKSQSGENCLQLISQVLHGISLISENGDINPWSTDFTDDLRRIAIPALVIHGETDFSAPATASALALDSLLVNSEIRIIRDGSHCLPWTNSEQVNKLLIDFICA